MKCINILAGFLFGVQARNNKTRIICRIPLFTPHAAELRQHNTKLNYQSSIEEAEESETHATYISHEMCYLFVTDTERTRP